MHDYTKADLDSQTRAMLDYTFKLTVTPTDVHHGDFETLKGAGVDDQQVLSTVLITCLFNFMTRVADGFGGRAGAWAPRASGRLAAEPCARPALAHGPEDLTGARESG